MIITISIFVGIAFLVFVYTVRLKNDNNKIIENLNNHAKKEKIKQQQSKILGRKKIKRKTNQKKRACMHHV